MRDKDTNVVAEQNRNLILIRCVISQDRPRLETTTSRKLYSECQLKFLTFLAIVLTVPLRLCDAN